MTTSANNDIPFVPENTLDPAAGLNLAITVIDALLQLAVLDLLLDTPPGSPAEGDRYIVGTSPTGDWAGHANELARWDGTVWQFFGAVLALNLNDGALYKFTSGTWSELTSTTASSWLQLSDTPSAYTGAAGKAVAVNSTPNGLQFVTAAFLLLGAEIQAGDANKVISVKAAEDGFELVSRYRGGTTANRPASPILYQDYFDADLNKPIWWNGTNWVDATGTTV